MSEYNREMARQDPPGQHWKNPYLDDDGKEFCGHCGSSWVDGHCEAARDGIMFCPCGRGDFELCADCPYPFCSVHGLRV